MDKAEFLTALESLIRMADPSVKGLRLVCSENLERGLVLIEFQGGYKRVIEITGNSPLATIVDIAEKCLYG